MRCDIVIQRSTYRNSGGCLYQRYEYEQMMMGKSRDSKSKIRDATAQTAGGFGAGDGGRGNRNLEKEGPSDMQLLFESMCVIVAVS